ncbi:MAG: GNAT family N-acetyltransferase [Oscillospiraceae bacterium]|nr:GNAT family N-acetyltransferase [Oscillospiraceae bacterium]
MIVTDFTKEHIPQAQLLARKNYEEERSNIRQLPPFVVLPDLTELEGNHLGVAAFESDRMIGYMCCYNVFDNAFGTTDTKGVWSAVHMHAASGNLQQVYDLMYQAAAKKWVAAGALSHGITFYTHDEIPIQCLFRRGFGMRCIDAVKLIESHTLKLPTTLNICEIEASKADRVLTLKNALIEHLSDTPCFMKYPLLNGADVIAKVVARNSRIFILCSDNQIVAFLEITSSGESFVTETDSFMNICGGYLIPQLRGRGMFDLLLEYCENQLYKEGYEYLGVDFESLNPAAYGFWLKHFKPYTYSLVRRIDESTIKLSHPII